MIERTFIQQNMKRIELENFIKSNMDRAGFTRLEVVKTPLVTRLIVNVTHPGLAIGKSGQNIKRLTREIEEKFKIENPQLEIQEIKTPELDAKATVDRMKTLLERGFSWRSIAYKIVHDISSKGAQGVEIVLSGALGGKGERKRQQRIATGYMKKTGDQVRLVDYAKATSYPKYGAIGIKLRIVRPETVFPDKINIKDIISPKPVVEEKSEEKEAKEQEENGEAEKKEEKAHKAKEHKEGEKKHADKKEEKGHAEKHKESEKKEEAKEEKAHSKHEAAKKEEKHAAEEKKEHPEKEAKRKEEEKAEARKEHSHKDAEKQEEEKKEHAHKEEEKNQEAEKTE